MRARHAIAKVVDDETLRLKTAKREAKASRRAQVFLQAAAQDVQQHAHSQIAGVVSRCLEAVFDEPYEFKLTFVRRRQKTEAVLTFVRGDLEVEPLDSSGGGAVDVATFALRLARLLLSQPAGRRVMILDEPFKFVSAEYHSRLRELLETLAVELEVQFIMVTHIEELQTGTVIRL